MIVAMASTSATTTTTLDITITTSSTVMIMTACFVLLWLRHLISSMKISTNKSHCY